jgi:hypothetical protein
MGATYRLCGVDGCGACQSIRCVGRNMTAKNPPFEPVTIEALSRAVCEAWEWEPDKDRIWPVTDQAGTHTQSGPAWQHPLIQRTVLAFLAMRRVGATLPKREEPNRG